jgi:hypothetical protein
MNIFVDTKWKDCGGRSKQLKNLLDRLTQMSCAICSPGTKVNESKRDFSPTVRIEPEIILFGGGEHR